MVAALPANVWSDFLNRLKAECALPLVERDAQHLTTAIAEVCQGAGLSFETSKAQPDHAFAGMSKSAADRITANPSVRANGLKVKWFGPAKLDPEVSLPSLSFELSSKTVVMSGAAFSDSTSAQALRPFHAWMSGMIEAQAARRVELHLESAGSLTLDRLQLALVYVKRGRVVRITPAAQKLLDARDGLVLEGDMLTCIGPNLQRKFQDWVETESTSTSSFFRVERLGTRSPYLLHRLLSFPCPPESIQLFHVLDFRRSANTSPEVLQDAFGLTWAEGRLAATLATGCSPKEAAVAIGVSVETVRSQIRNLFLKTGTSRQSELIVAILGGPSGAMFAHDPPAAA